MDSSRDKREVICGHNSQAWFGLNLDRPTIVATQYNKGWASAVLYGVLSSSGGPVYSGRVIEIRATRKMCGNKHSGFLFNAFHGLDLLWELQNLAMLSHMVQSLIQFHVFTVTKEDFSLFFLLFLTRCGSGQHKKAQTSSLPSSLTFHFFCHKSYPCSWRERGGQ